jgi:acetylglutamate kinase
VNDNQQPLRPQTCVIKYGGNAMVNEELQEAVLLAVGKLKERGHRIVLAHGGGPFIERAMEQAGLQSEFVYGHRKTTPEAMRLVESALKGEVNSQLVGTLNRLGYSAVGLSGKDGRMVTARKRYHRAEQENGRIVEADLGQVGEVASVRPALLELLLDQGYLPVMACVAQDESGQDFNINADLFAAGLAGALRADVFALLTDVDGLLRDPETADSLIRYASLGELEGWLQEGFVTGGMLPKVEACRTALVQGAQQALILNGTVPERLASLFETKDLIGTRFTQTL